MKLVFVYISFLLFLSQGCAHVAKGIRPTKNMASLKTPLPPLTEPQRKKLVIAAKKNLGKPKIKVGKKAFRADCSGTIRGIFYEAQLRLGSIIKAPDDNDVKTIFSYVKKHGTIKDKNPKPGDLVFFHNTFDKNLSGKMDAPLTHIGIVEKIQGKTVHFIHHLGQAIIRSRMTLSHKDLNYDPKTKERLNHVLRRAIGRQGSYNAAQLFAGFGEL